MKQNHSSKRHRGRSNGRRGSHGAGHSIESNGPDVKIRGKASQLYEKYQALSHDALSSGDRIASESYLQHAEHYYRVMAAQAPQNGDNSHDNRSRAGRDREEKNTTTSGSSTEGDVSATTKSPPGSDEVTGDSSSDGSAIQGDEASEGGSAAA